MIQIPRNSIHHNRGHIALDQRADVVDEFVGDIGPVLGDPFSRNHLLHIGDLVDIPKVRGGLIRIVGKALDDDHLTGIAFVGCLHGSTADLKGFEDVDSGCQMGSGSLHGA